MSALSPHTTPSCLSPCPWLQQYWVLISGTRLQGREPLGPGYSFSQLLTSLSLGGALSQIQS